MHNNGKIKLFKRLSKKEFVSRIIFLGLILCVIATSVICILNAVKWINKPFAGFLINQRNVIVTTGQYHWTGTQAGLKYPDKIIKANDSEISSMRDLEEMVKNTDKRNPIRYIFDRNGSLIEKNISVMRFTFLDFLLCFGIPFLSGIIYLFIGIVVFILKPDTKVSWAFLLACFFLSVYTITAFDLISTQWGFIRFYLLVETFVPAAFLYLSLIFPEKRTTIEKRPFLSMIPYVISTILVIPMQIYYPGPIYLHVYNLAQLYLLVSAIIFIASVMQALFKKSSIIARQRAKVILFGASLAFPFPALITTLPRLGVESWVLKIPDSLTAFPLLFFPASIAYAIARHNLFDVDVYIKRAVGYGIMTALVGMTYFLIQIILETIILRPILGDSAEKVYPIIFALFVVFFFNPLNKKVQEIVDKLFYRKKFNYKDTIISVSNALTSLLNLEEIVKKVITTVRKEMFIDKAGIILVASHKTECQTIFISDDPVSHSDNIVGGCVPCDDPLLALVSREKKLITEYDIAEDSRYNDVKESCMKRFEEVGASIAFPLMYQNEVTGILALGHKKSGHFYTREDIYLLETLTNQGAIAIENAKLAEQMKKEETIRTSLSRYLSPQIVDQIVKDNVRVNLGGDRKVVTVLFSDIRNFTTITETRPADQLIHILNEYFSEMAKIIFDNQGSLDKYIGDAIVAVFGSLVHVENPVRNAVNAAVQMMKQMPLLNRHWMEEFGFSMHIGIGINTGEVFLGNIGSPERMEFTVIGDTVNVASRFSGLAKAGQILLTKDAFTSLNSPDIKYNELPPSEVKGKSGKLEVFEIVY